MRTLIILSLLILSGCEQSETEKKVWDGVDRVGKHIVREMLRDD